MSSTRAHCGNAVRQYRSRRHFPTGSIGAEAVFGALTATNVNLHVYACGTCGSVELFDDGYDIPHPLPRTSGA